MEGSHTPLSNEATGEPHQLDSGAQAPENHARQPLGLWTFTGRQINHFLWSLIEAVLQPEHELRRYQDERIAVLHARLIAEKWISEQESAKGDECDYREYLKGTSDYQQFKEDLEKRELISKHEVEDLLHLLEEHFLLCILGTKMAKEELPQEIARRRLILFDLLGTNNGLLNKEGEILQNGNPSSGFDHKALKKAYCNVLTEVRNAYIFSKRRDRLKTATAIFVTVPFLILMTALVACAACQKSVVYYVVGAGLLGSFLSILLRLTKLGGQESPVSAFMQVTYGRSSLLFSLLIGGLTPLLGCLLLSAGHIHGALLPDVSGLETLTMERRNYEGVIMTNTVLVRFPLEDGPALLQEIEKSVRQSDRSTCRECVTNLNNSDSSKPLVASANPISPNDSPEETNTTSTVKSSTERTHSNRSDSRLSEQRKLFVLNSGMSGFARLLLFAFLCGWAERLIPDALDKALSRIRGKS